MYRTSTIPALLKYNFLIVVLFYFSSNIAIGQVPTPTVGLLLNTPEAFNGYTLFIGGQKKTYLVNNCGELINNWESSFSAGSTVYLMPNGNLIRPIRIGSTNFNGGGIGGGIEIVDWSGNLVWRYDYHENNEHHQHHDIEPLPNGNILILAWSYIDEETALASGRHNEGEVWPTQIVEVEPLDINEANIVWLWNAWDHIIQDVDSGRLNYGNVFEHPELIDVNIGSGGLQGNFRGADWLHCNSVEYIEELDLILVSSKYLHEIFIIDHSTSTAEAASNTGGNYEKGGDLLYRWGNPQNYGRGNTTDRKLKGQHDAIWLPKTDTSRAQIMVVNNGNKGTVDAWIPPINSKGFFAESEFAPYGPLDFNWSHEADIKSSIGCSARQMPNGNVLYCDAKTGLMEEVTLDFKEVWQYQNPVNITGPVEQGIDISENGGGGFGSFRAEKYAPGYFDTILNLTPKGVIELAPYESTCSLYVDKPDSIITYNSTAQINHFKIEIFPNPASRWLYIANTNNLFNELKLSKSNGQIVIEQNFNTKVSVDMLSPGLYLLTLFGKQHKIAKKVLIQ